MQSLSPPDFNAGDIADAVDGTLHRDVIFKGQGLAVWLPAWPNYADVPGAVDTVQLEWARGEAPGEGDYELADLQAYEGPMNGDSFPKRVTVPPEMLRPDGACRLRYRVITAQGGIAVSDPHALICDTTPPVGTGQPPVPGIPPGFISDDYLVNNPDGVVWTLPDYAGGQASDVVEFWWTLGPPADPGSLPPLTATVGASPITLHVPPDVVNATGDGGCYLTYLLRDKAGNRSGLSVPVRLAVALGPLPVNLQPPLVPLADDGLLDLRDAQAGIDVFIPAFDNGKPTDRIEVFWGTTRVLEQALGEGASIPLAVRVPSKVLRETYGAATGPVATEVSYRIVRGDVPFDAPVTTVNVNFYVAGPDLPDWPDPVNPLLSAPRVFGAVSNVLNELKRDDEGQPALLKFDLYTPLNVDEEIEFYWNDVLVAEATHTVGAGDVPGTEVQVSIPWAYIEAAENHPQLPVHYRLRAPGSPNQQYSPTTLVNADAYTLRPPATTIQKTFNGMIINCDTLDGDDHAVLVSVPDLSAWLNEGDTVTLTWSPMPEVTGDLILEEAVKEETLTLDGTNTPPSGFTWRVQPYEDHVLPVCQYKPNGNTGRVRVHYVFIYKGEQVRSHTEEKVLATHDNQVCCQFTARTAVACGCC